MSIILERALLHGKSHFLRLYCTAVHNFTSNTPHFDSIDHPDHHSDHRQFDSEKIKDNTQKSLRIAILGLPNVGKSTVINRLIRRPLCAASSKVQTTRQKSNVVYTEGNTQLIFVDTPGVVTEKDVKKYSLEHSFMADVATTAKSAECVGFIQDVSHYKAAVINERMMKVLKKIPEDVATILILNKVDLKKKKTELLSIIDSLRNGKDYPVFKDIFMISALNNDGIDDLRTYILNLATSRDWEYKASDFCSDPPEVLVRNTTRAAFMDELPHNIPYEMEIILDHYKILPDGSINILVSVKTTSDRISSLAMGFKGRRLRKVALDAEQKLASAFRTAVRLKITILFANKEMKLRQKAELKQMMS